MEMECRQPFGLAAHRMRLLEYGFPRYEYGDACVVSLCGMAFLAKAKLEIA
jgi:hypothetical protein